MHTAQKIRQTNDTVIDLLHSIGSIVESNILLEVEDTYFLWHLIHNACWYTFRRATPQIGLVYLNLYESC